MGKQILICGLGRFGQSLALSLLEMGAEVMGVDEREEAVDEISSFVTHAIIADTTEEKVVREMGIGQFDAVVCAIGSHIEASLMTAVLLREHGAKMIVAKASSALHGRVLEKVGVERVIYPEREVAARLARDFMVAREFIEVVPLTVQHSMFELKSPPHYAGRTLVELDLRGRFGFLVVAIRRGDDTVVAPGPEEVIRRSDLLVVVGDRVNAERAVKGES